MARGANHWRGWLAHSAVQETTVLRPVCTNHCTAFRPQARIESYCPAGSGLSAEPLASPHTGPHNAHVPPRTTPTAIVSPASLGPVANSLILSCAGRQLVSFCAGYAGLAASGGGGLAMVRSGDKVLGSSGWTPLEGSAAVSRQWLYKQRRPSLSTWFAGLSTVVPAPTFPLPQTLQRPELARHHESGKKVSR